MKRDVSLNELIFLENVDAIIGRSASPELLSKITYVTFNHDERYLI
jgi:hypothetical protein